MGLSMGQFRHPGPGFLPFGLAVVLICLSLALILSSRTNTHSPVPFWGGRTWVRPLLGVIIFLLYAFLISYLGFIATTFLFLIFWMWVIERIRWATILSISVGVTAVLYLIFEFFLEVPLPASFLNS